MGSLALSLSSFYINIPYNSIIYVQGNYSIVIFLGFRFKDIEYGLGFNIWGIRFFNALFNFNIRLKI